MEIEMKTIVRILACAAPVLMNAGAGLSDANAQSLQELQRSLLFPSNADIAQGKTLAAQACGSCHSLDGVSVDPTLPHLAGQHVVYLYEELKAYKQGNREDESMRKAVEFLSDDAFRKVSIYYASLVPPGPAASAAGGGGGRRVCRLSWERRQQSDPRHAQSDGPISRILCCRHEGL
jgi:cytochrome c553